MSDHFMTPEEFAGRALEDEGLEYALTSYYDKNLSRHLSPTFLSDNPELQRRWTRAREDLIWLDSFLKKFIKD